MKFAISSEQRDFGASLRELLAASNVPSVVRSWAAGDLDPGRKLWERLAEAGVLSLGLPEQHGGYGASAVDLVVAFEELGRAAVPGPYVESVAVLPGLLAATADAHLLTAIGAGEVMATVALPPEVPYASDGSGVDAVFLVDNGRLFRATVTSELASVDSARRLSAVRATHDLAAVDASAAFNFGALAVSAQLLGLGHALLDRATEYAKQRVQFGRPVGEFQAVKHQLADVAVALEFARPLLYAAALTVDAKAQTVSRDVSAAKIACGEAAYRAARTALQVHGAIGYTAEYDLALWLTKVRALVSTWGTRAMHRSRVLGSL